MSRSSSVAVPAPVVTAERLWTAQDVSAFLVVPVATLHQWRYLGIWAGCLSGGSVSAV